ncbi:MAG TPA: E3 binding domain-containing protein [Solirubrobacterales bacterium]|jgi:hypothetical protein
MAARKNGRSGSSKRRSGGRSASQKPDKYRFAQNVDGEETAAESTYRAYAAEQRDGGPDAGPDVLIDVPVLKVDSIHLELDDLDAHVALKAKILELVNLNVGVDAHLGKVRLDIKGVEAQALLKVRLDHVAAIVDRVLTTVDRNPELIESIGRTVRSAGAGAEQTLGSAGRATERIGEGAEGALGELGQGAGEAVEGVGSGAGEAAANPGQVVQNAGHAAGELAGGASDLVSGDPATRAKAAAKLTVKELGEAAQAKVKGISEKRRQRKAERAHATDRAMELADDLGVDLEAIEGSGAEGKITVKDVRAAASAQ